MEVLQETKIEDKSKCAAKARQKGRGGEIQGKRKKCLRGYFLCKISLVRSEMEDTKGKDVVKIM